MAVGFAAGGLGAVRRKAARLLALATLLEGGACTDTSQPENARQHFVEVPDHALEAFGGHLYGIDRGEYIGRLWFQDDTGRLHVLLNDNVHGIARTTDGIVVFTGLVHLGINQGDVHIAERLPNGNVGARHLIRLPGAPSQVTARADGSVTFLVYADYTDRGPLYECYVLRGRSISRSLDCLPPAGRR